MIILKPYRFLSRPKDDFGFLSCWSIQYRIFYIVTQVEFPEVISVLSF